MKKPKKPNPPPSGAAGHKSQGGPGVSAPGSAPGSSPAKSASAVVEEVDGEPMMKRAPVPAPLIALLGALVYWGSMYILEYGGEADARVHYPYTSFKELQDYQPKDPAEIAKAKGLRIYLET